jgi:hypothetical protein
LIATPFSMLAAAATRHIDGLIPICHYAALPPCLRLLRRHADDVIFATQQLLTFYAIDTTADAMPQCWLPPLLLSPAAILFSYGH